MPEFEIDCYWNPYDWFEPVINGLREKWKCGMNATEIIDSESLGNLHEGMCRRDEAIEWLEQMIKEWEKDDFWVICEINFTTDIQLLRKKRTKSVEPPKPPTTANNGWEYEIDL
jgi:hypothetical protein